MNIPIRSCIACRRRAPKSELIRVVAGDHDRAYIDAAQHAPGRGAYICPDEKCLQRARKTRVFGRALKCSISDEIYTDLEGYINERT